MGMKKPMAAAALMMGALAAGVALGSGTPPEAGGAPDLQDVARPAPGQGVAAALDLRRWPVARFHEALTARIDALSSAHGPERPGVFLDMAEMFLGQMMLYEARSVVDGVVPQLPFDKRRWRALRDAVLLLSGEPAPELLGSPLSDPGREDRALWLVLQAIAEGDGAMLRANLHDAPEALAAQPLAVQRAVLPSLTEAAVEAGDGGVVGRTLMMLEDLPDLSSAPVGHYLRGRAAEMEGRASTALESYFEATRGWDRYAARARLALADMALADGGHGALLAAQDVLEYGVDAWRGDRYELEVLEHLAAVYSRSGDAVGALVVLGKLMLRFPDTPEAARAEVRAAEDMAVVYRDGAEGRLPLARWLSVHVQLVPLYRHFPDFAAHTETLAGRALEIGGTDLAAMEYRRALSLLEELDEFSGQPVSPERFAELRMKLARALMRGGLAAEARDELARIVMPEDQALRQRINALRAEALADLGESEELLRTHVATPDARNLRDVGLALWQGGNWPEAMLFYRRLWSGFPDQFSARDASYLLLAARKSGNERVAAEVVAAFPDLTSSASWIEIAESLMEAPAPIAPLSEEAAAQRLESLERALGTMRDTGL